MNMTTTFKLRVSLLGMALLVLAPLRLLAQAATGEMSITVSDSTGAAVPGAQVVITGTDTGAVVRTLTTNSAGIAEVPLLQPGRYNTHVTAPGFKAFDRNGVTVDVDSVVSLNLALQLGEASEVVTVTGALPVIEEKSETISEVIDSHQVLAIPLQGRNYLDAANYVPGVVPTAASRDNTFSAYGNTGLQNAFLLDGARNVNYIRGLDNRRRDIIRPPLDALNEFTVDTSNFSAQYGASAGAVVNAITKSGSNQLHGSLYDFMQNDHANAINYFALTRPLLVQNQYGGSVGGPIIHDKLFFFAAYEGIHERDEIVSSAVVPTALQRMGNFAVSGPNIYDPTTTVGTGTSATRTQFPGNMITTPSTIGSMLINLYPLPNAGGNKYIRNAPERITSYNGISRVDWQISPNNSVFGRYAQSQIVTSNEAPLPAPASNPGTQTVPSKGIGAGYTRIFTPTVVNEFFFSWATTGGISNGTQPRNEVIPGSLDPAVFTGTPIFTVNGFTAIGNQAPCCGNSPINKTAGVFDFADNLSWSRRKHQFKFGGEFLWIRPSTFATSNGRAGFTFDGVFTQNPMSRGNTGSALADLLLGDADMLTTGTVAQNQERAIAYGLYGTDQYQLTHDLTVTYGVRYEYTSPSTETQNRQANLVLDPGPLYGQFIIAGDPRLPRTLIYPDRNNIAPRVGIAYKVPGVKDMSVRAAYGIFYAQDEGTGVTNRLTSNPPFFGYGSTTISSNQLNPATGFQLTPTASIARPNPIAPSSFVLVPSSTATLVSYPEHFKTAYVQQWNASVQKLLGSGIMAEVNFVGNHGSQLLGLGQGNQPTVLNSTTVNSRRPLYLTTPAITDASVKTVGNWNSSEYSGVSAKVEKRFSNDLSFTNAFTYGHAFDLQNPALDLCDGCGAGDTLQNNYNRPQNYASSDNDVRFRYVLTGLVQSPSGRHYFGSAVAGAVLGGWGLSPVYIYQTGLPLTASMSYDASNAGNVTRPTQVCPNPNRGGAGNLTQWFNTACFVNTASYTFGNASRNNIRAPGQNYLNLSAQRNFPLYSHDRVKLNLRADVFDIFNHPQFGQPSAVVGSATYGQITSTVTAGAGTTTSNSIPSQRQVQLAARITF
jgi:hypothetical protein